MNYFIVFYFIALFYIASCATINHECIARNFGNGSPVCVCNSSYCDTVPSVKLSSSVKAVVYTSSKSGHRFQHKIVQLTSRMSSPRADIVLNIDTSQKFQSIIGFGGAFTDSAGMNIASLPILAQENLLTAYFGEGGIGYTMARVPMASCDFSRTNYSYNDYVGDLKMEHFALTEDDYQFKIPFIKRASKISSRKIKFFANPWSAPYWMKTNQMMQGVGTLLGRPGGEHYKAWANYFIKFLDEYAKQGVNFWAITEQNQPTNGLNPTFIPQSMGYTPKMLRDFLKLDLGPALANSAHNQVKIMILDDQRYLLPKWPETILNDPEAAKYVSYIALHWYGNSWSPLQILQETHEMFPDTPLIGTEACVIGPPGEKVVLGSWQRAEQYARDIIETLNNWYTGWNDWNLALDLRGGPNWVENYVDSSIIVNASSGEFYKQPMYYAMGHFSKFLPPDSVRIGLEMNFKNLNKTILATAFQNSEGNKVAVLLNTNEEPLDVVINEKSKRTVLAFSIPAQSVQTVLWK